jgi:hypothetical protein
LYAKIASFLIKETNGIPLDPGFDINSEIEAVDIDLSKEFNGTIVEPLTQ